jgi:hypothetical protein
MVSGSNSASIGFISSTPSDFRAENKFIDGHFETRVLKMTVS